MRFPLRISTFLIACACLMAACDGVDPVSESSASHPGALLSVEINSKGTSAKTGDFATTVVSATQGDASPSGPIAGDRSIPANALGAPDAVFFSLGFDRPSTSVQEGELIVSFGAGRMLDGITLTVFEETYGGKNALLEKADVYVSEQANGPWHYVGTAHNDGSTENTRPIDTDITGQCVGYVRIVDRTDPRLFNSERRGDGFDVNAVQIQSSGSCAKTTIAGTVFADGDGDGVKDASESGMSDVLVRLTNGSTVVETTTSSTGAFSALVTEGTYTVSIPSSASGAFNAQLYDTHTYTGGASAERAVTVGPPAADVDFGFALDVAGVTAALRSGEIQTDGRDHRFWTRQARHACLPSRARVDVSSSQLREYLNQINALLLPVPFQFSQRNGFCEARDILAPPAQGEIADFLRELLTAELNVVSGNGSGSPAFDQAILAFAESVAAEQVYGVTSTSSGKTFGTAASLSETTKLLATYNSSGGGGGVGNN